MTNLFNARHSQFGPLILDDTGKPGDVTTPIPVAREPEGDLLAFRVWPDGTTQDALGEPYSFMSDDFTVVLASDEEAALRAAGIAQPEETFTQRLSRMATEIHADNVKAGWWTDLHTGACIKATRNRPELMMLVVSELSEASEGIGVPDDKLPQFQGFDVELADAAIRLLDMIGAEGAEETAFDEFWDGGPMWQWVDVNTALMYVVNYISHAMEHYRKGRYSDYADKLGDALLTLFDIATAYHVDLFHMISEKRRYNSHRLDHQPENRRKEGGKQF